MNPCSKTVICRRVAQPWDFSLGKKSHTMMPPTDRRTSWNVAACSLRHRHSLNYSRDRSWIHVCLRATRRGSVLYCKEMKHSCVFVCCRVSLTDSSLHPASLTPAHFTSSFTPSRKLLPALPPGLPPATSNLSMFLLIHPNHLSLASLSSSPKTFHLQTAALSHWHLGSWSCPTM